MTINKPYFTYSSVYMLQGCDLYSGGENDPVIDATIYAMDHLAYDYKGNKLPFDIQVSIFAQDIDRDKELLEDKPKTYMQWDSKLAVTVIVFYNIEDYMKYKLDGNIILN